MKTLPLFLLAALLGAPAFGQNEPLALLYESATDFRLALGDEADLWRQHDPRDADFDGLPELALIAEDENGDPKTFLVYSQGAGDDLFGEELVTLPIIDVAALLDGQEPTRFVGFYPFFGNSLKEMVFRTSGGLGIIAILTGEQAEKALTTAIMLPAEQVAIADLDDDGAPELIVRNHETQTVQVWGRPTSLTATEEIIEAALFRLFQSYPNPFREATTIAYEVEQPGPVTLIVYDLLGRRVRTLVDGMQPAGRHYVRWDGRNAGGQPVASGAYFYRIEVGGAVSSRQTLRIQ